ncbi:MAG: GyrI-like domain-containing protein [Planctomycetes bacterium]|nr:GyrI-like domain-containing protein [Planctomycetota bacterium]
MSSVRLDPPVIVTRDAFHVVGLRERYEQGKQMGIPAQWDRFVPRIDEIANRSVHRTYGVCVCEARDPASSPGGPPHFQYTACAEVSAIERVPDGMIGFTVPGGTFAVFTHRGPISEFGATIQAVWGGGLAAAGLTPTGAPDFELYDERFCGGGEGSVVEIFIPVVPRE